MPSVGHDTDNRAARRREQLLTAGRHLNARGVHVRLVCEHSGVVARGSRQTQSVAGLLLEAAHHCGHRAHWQHVAHLMRTCHVINDSRYVPLRAFHARLDFAIETLGAFGSLALELIESLVSRLRARASKIGASLVYRRLGAAVQAGKARRIIEAHMRCASRHDGNDYATDGRAWRSSEARTRGASMLTSSLCLNAHFGSLVTHLLQSPHFDWEPLCRKFKKFLY